MDKKTVIFNINLTIFNINLSPIFQDVTHNMSLLTNDLFKVENTLDTVTTCTILPDITLPS
jgi:hypothetical protein